MCETENQRFEQLKTRYTSINIVDDSRLLFWSRFLWHMIDEDMEDIEKDKIQYFKLRKDTENENTQIIEHSQEEPFYYEKYRFNTENPVDIDILAVDEEEYSALIIAEDY